MDPIESLIQGYRTFRSGLYRQNEAHYRALADRQQTPKAVIVACCDSRADPAMVFNTDPGELFVVRNVANIVPPYEPDTHYHGTSAALEFAVTGLDIRDVIVMGHARCGGINALRQAPEKPIAGEFLPGWISLLQPVAEKLTRENPSLAEDDFRRALERAAVVASLDTLRTFPFIREREAAGRVRIHGWFYGIASGQLSVYNSDTGVFEDVPDEA